MWAGAWSLTLPGARSTTDLVGALLAWAGLGIDLAGAGGAVVLGRGCLSLSGCWSALALVPRGRQAGCFGRSRGALLVCRCCGVALDLGVCRDLSRSVVMLKMVSKKSVLLLGAVLALCAFVLPSVASAASWAPVGTTDGRIDSGNLGFSLPINGSGSFCTASSFNVTVDTAAVATITSASFANCHGDLGGGVGCTTTATGTNFPWRVTVPDTTDIIIHGVDIDVYFETTPNTLNECPQTGANIRLTGTVTASFTPGAAGNRTFDFGSTLPGFTAHIPGVGTVGAVARGRAVATGLLNVVM
jgi:hypothetical protein